MMEVPNQPPRLRQEISIDPEDLRKFQTKEYQAQFERIIAIGKEIMEKPIESAYHPRAKVKEKTADDLEIPPPVDPSISPCNSTKAADAPLRTLPLHNIQTLPYNIRRQAYPTPTDFPSPTEEPENLPNMVQKRKGRPVLNREQRRVVYYGDYSCIEHPENKTKAWELSLWYWREKTRGGKGFIYPR